MPRPPHPAWICGKLENPIVESLGRENDAADRVNQVPFRRATPAAAAASTWCGRPKTTMRGDPMQSPGRDARN
jgi:hypothetical protein